MNNKILAFGIGGLIVGLVAGFFFAKSLSAKPSTMTLNSANDINHSSKTFESATLLPMQEMVSKLNGKTGEEFDKAFMEQMIMHHEGAVAMAEAALKSASHPEIKQMAQDIISAQTKEITQMKDWQTQWFKK